MKINIMQQDKVLISWDESDIIEEIAQDMVIDGQASDYNQALEDLYSDNAFYIFTISILLNIYPIFSLVSHLRVTFML